jgi:DNA replication licensing factor MCM2
MDNVDLTDAILSRFDILCVLKDEIQDSKDRQLATFVINSHIKNHPTMNKDNLSKILLKDMSHVKAKKDLIRQDLFKKYVLYARTNIFPKLANIDRRKISSFYTKIREE